MSKNEKEPNIKEDPVGHREWDLKRFFGDLFKIILVFTASNASAVSSIALISSIKSLTVAAAGLAL